MSVKVIRDTWSGNVKINAVRWKHSRVYFTEVILMIKKQCFKARQHGAKTSSYCTSTQISNCSTTMRNAWMMAGKTLNYEIIAGLTISPVQCLTEIFLNMQYVIRLKKYPSLKQYKIQSNVSCSPSELRFYTRVFSIVNSSGRFQLLICFL